jgi:hypothetical protein
MFDLLKFYYDAAPGFMDFIWDYTSRTLQMDQPEQRDFRLYGIFFWKEVAALEAELGRPGHSLVQTASETLLPLFFKIMTEVDPLDTDVEDPDSQSSLKFATVAIQAFFAAAPDAVFEFICPTFEAAIASHDWAVRHAGTLLLYCMCPLDGEAPRISENSRQFVSAHVDSLLVACGSEIP